MASPATPVSSINPARRAAAPRRSVATALRFKSDSTSPANATPRMPTLSPRKANSAPRFLPVNIAATAASPIEVLLPSGLIVRVPAHDTAALRTVLELLERPAC